MTRTFVEYDPSWPSQYEVEHAVLDAGLGQSVQAIHHIGSTAIQGMPGKGIIDILIEVEDVNNIEDVVVELAKQGYIYRPVPGRDESPFFTKPSEKPRSHNVHIAQKNGQIVNNHLAFRDYLNANQEAFSRYETCKRSLVEAEPGNWNHYSQQKLVVAGELVKEALAWRANREMEKQS